MPEIHSTPHFMIALDLLAHARTGHAQKQNVLDAADFNERKNHFDQVAVEINFLVSDSLSFPLSRCTRNIGGRTFRWQLAFHRNLI